MHSVREQRRRRTAIVVCTCAVAGALLGPLASESLAQLRVVSMNAANSSSSSAGPRSGMDLILADIGARVSDDPTTAGNTGLILPPDVLLLQEVQSYATTSAQYATLLNSLYPGANYQYAQANGATTGAGTQGLVYNANAVTLIGTTLVGSASTSGQPRQTLRYQLRPVGYGASADLYIYNAHMKASSDSTSEGRRLVEATAIRANADALPEGTNIMYVGDFNVYSAADTAYAKLLSAGNGQAFDPIDKTWTHTSTSKNIHTQSPNNGQPSFTTGGMDDRFDFQLISGELNDDHGLSYITNSYQAWGNNGTHSLNSSIDTGTGAPANVLNAMANILDHLPIVADYRLPAKMAVTVSAVPAKVIAGSTQTLTVGVTNAAPVTYAIGADTLDYSVAGAGSVSGGVSATGKATLSGASNHPVTLSTATAGLKSGTVNVTSTSQQVANGTFSQAVNYTVVDHATGSLSAAATETSETIDFGYVPVGFASRTASFAIANRPSPSGFTADLALPSITGGGSAQLSHNAATFTNLPAGSQNNYTATLNTASAGNLSATYSFNVSDEAIPGAAAGAPLGLTMTARVISSASFPATGFIQLKSGETYNTGPFSVAAGVTLTKTGPGAMNVTGAQTNGASSTLAIDGGTVTMSTDAGSVGNGVLSVSTAGAGTSLTFGSSQHLAGLTVGSNSTVTLTAGGAKLLAAGPLSVSGTLDLNDNDAVVTATAETVRGYLLAGRAGGAWTGPGIVSTSAANNAQQTTGIAYAPAFLLGPTFDGEPVAPSALVLKYTWYGDANLDGKVDLDDYALVDRGMAAQLVGWTFGDFDYSGTVDAADYLLIDRAFTLQTGTLSPALLADREARFGAAYVGELVASVPEPSTLFMLAGVGPAFITMFGRRHRRRPLGT